MSNGIWKIIIILIVVISATIIFFMNYTNEDKGKDKENLIVDPVAKKEEGGKGNIAIFQTNFGDIELELFADKAPKTVENFIKLAGDGFYDGIKFHRVINGFMIQGGDPFSKDDSQKELWGQGGPGYTFEDEIHSENNNVIGSISMANAGPNTNGSQFFINTADNDFLDAKHTVFGKVINGMDVVMAISQVDVEYSSPMAQQPDRPVKPVIIEKVILK